jgi:hypothetical protein
MNSSVSRLIVRRGKTPQPEYALSGQTVVIGREPINDIMFQELEISRRHASISFVEGRYMVEDLNSTNGTFVNGRRISTPVVLNTGDVLDLGDTVSLAYQGPSQAATATQSVSEPAVVDQPTIQREADDVPPPYVPPAEVPQYGEPQTPPPQSSPVTRQAPTPPPTSQTNQPAYPPPNPAQMSPMPPPAKKRSRRTLYIGCGCLFILLIIGCIASLGFLDAYQGGDFLYCQSLRPVWELVFGVVRVTAICS